MPPKEAILQTFVSPPEPPPKTEREIDYEKKGIMSDQKKAEEKDKKKAEAIKKGDDSSSPPTPAMA